MANNSRFKTHSVGMTVKGEPYAFQLEGYVSSAAPYFSAAHDDKKAFLSASIGLPCPADQLMALAKNEYDKEKSYVAPEFGTIKLYGAAAEKFSSVLNKGRHVVVSGRLVWRQFTTKDGNPGERLEVEVDNLIDAGSYKDGVDPTVGNDIAVATLASRVARMAWIGPCPWPARSAVPSSAPSLWGPAPRVTLICSSASGLR